MYKTLSIKEFKSDLVLNCGKIAIIVLFSIVVIANFVPFYEATHDSYVYALKAISLTEGTWEVSNEKLLETGDWEFVPNSWKMTIHNTAIPKYPPGISAIGSISYLLGGINGLFYLGPFFAIILLIVSDRVATNLFGKGTGFLTILFLASNGIIFSGSIHLLSDNIFTALIVLGFFCLIKFLQHHKFSYLLLTSLILSFASFIRISGIIYFPIEIGIIVSFLVYSQIKKRNKTSNNYDKNKHTSVIKKQRILKISVVVIGPWLIFILFFMSFNNHYFGDPSITFYNVPDDPWVKPGTESYFSIFEPSVKNFEILKSYSNFVLPYPLYKIEILDFEKISQERNDPVTSSLLNLATNFIGKNNLGILTIFILSIAILTSFIRINKKSIILIFSLIICSNILFWSAGHVSFGRDSVLGRYMVPTFPLFSMIVSYLVVSWLKINSNKMSFGRKTLVRILKVIIIIGLILFLGVAWYNSPVGQWGIKDDFHFTNSVNVEPYYPLSLEGLEQNSIIVGGHSARTIDYGFTTFDPFLGTPSQRITLFNPELLDFEVMQKLKDLINEGNNIFVYKELLNKNDKVFREYLVSNQGYSIKEYSESFCKIEIQEKDKFEISSSDSTCLGLSED